LSANLKGPVKKPYQKPKLSVYGDIRTMTQSVASSMNMVDGQVLFGKLLKTH
jgi:hypothetical protein